MITRDNINDVICLISSKDIKRIVNTNKEYCVLELFITNTIQKVFIRLTNDYNRYKNIGNSGGTILDLVYIKELIEKKLIK